MGSMRSKESRASHADGSSIWWWNAGAQAVGREKLWGTATGKLVRQEAGSGTIWFRQGHITPSHSGQLHAHSLEVLLRRLTLHVLTMNKVPQLVLQALIPGGWDWMAWTKASRSASPSLHLSSKPPLYTVRSHRPITGSATDAYLDAGLPADR